MILKKLNEFSSPSKKALDNVSLKLNYSEVTINRARTLIHDARLKIPKGLSRLKLLNHPNVQKRIKAIVFQKSN